MITYQNRQLDTDEFIDESFDKLNQNSDEILVDLNNLVSEDENLQQQIDALILGAANATIGAYPITTTGTDTYTGTFTDLTYFIGLFINLTGMTANTTASTFNLNGLGAKDIKVRLSGGTLRDVNANELHDETQVIYDGTQFVIIDMGALQTLINLGDITTLTTADKTSAVKAINELNANIGDIATLTTTDKTSTVNAINEVNAKPSGVNNTNQLINGNFDVNQREVSNTVVLAAGEYGHDRFRGGSGGCTYTFATSLNVTTITISAGTLEQEVEGINLQSGTHTLSWTGTAQGQIDGGGFAASGVTETLAGGTNAIIEFNTGTLTATKLEEGDTATDFIHKTYDEEEKECKRYFERIIQTEGSSFGAGFVIDADDGQFAVPHAAKRVAPTVTVNNYTSFRIHSAAITPTCADVVRTINGGIINSKVSMRSATAVLTAGYGAILVSINGTASIDVDAEL